MKYAHLFWRLFGVPAHQWDDIELRDLPWMRTAADKYEASQKEAGGHR